MKRGIIKVAKIKDRTGETGVNNQGCKMKIVRYYGARNIQIEFEDGTNIEGCEYSHFVDGSISNNNHPSVYGHGYLGYGEYNGYENGKITNVYKVWNRMLERCYSNLYKSKQPTYINCKVSNEFLNFQKFAEFYYQNKWTDDLILIPDKDILTHGENKIYSRDTILFVDQRINNLFIKSDVKRGDFPVGVTYHKRDDIFESNCSVKDYNGITNRRVYIGRFSTQREAFLAYKNFKEKYIKYVADDYAKKYPNFPIKLYNAMIAYRVNIND